jgi:hypothetical protein
VTSSWSWEMVRGLPCKRYFRTTSDPYGSQSGGAKFTY